MEIKSNSTRAALPRREDAPAGLFLDANGRWYHDGDLVRHARLSALLTRSIARDGEGNLIVTTGHDVVAFVAEDAPHLVRTISTERGTWVFTLGDDETEALTSRTALVATQLGAFYTVVKHGRFWAKLSRSAAHKVASHLEGDDDNLEKFRLSSTPGIEVVVLSSTSAMNWSAVPASEHLAPSATTGLNAGAKR